MAMMPLSVYTASPDDAPMELGAPAPSDPFFTSAQNQADFMPEANTMPQVGVTLNINDYVNWSEGGQSAPVDNLGWSTGIFQAFGRWAAWAGQVLIPANTAAIMASQQYGDVGLDNRNQVLVGQYDQQYNTYLPSEETLAGSALIPGGM